jgi:hypothetical protein
VFQTSLGQVQKAKKNRDVATERSMHIDRASGCESTQPLREILAEAAGSLTTTSLYVRAAINATDGQNSEAHDALLKTDDHCNRGIKAYRVLLELLRLSNIAPKK